jgi:hypothetical protein
VPGYRIDLRSDIHTVPTAAMYRAMADAAVGDERGAVGDQMKGRRTGTTDDADERR